jgi:hypothetical protein
VDARVRIVPVEQVLALGVGGAAHALEKGGELGVGHGTPVDPERFERHRMCGPLVRQAAVVAHREGAARQAHHVIRCRAGGREDASEERKADCLAAALA